MVFIEEPGKIIIDVVQQQGCREDFARDW